MRVAILLAAGSGTRFGRHDKLLMPLAGKPVLMRALELARGQRVARVIVVVDPRRPRRTALLRAPGVQVVRAARTRHGMGASLAAAFAALRPIEREALIFLADMPFARSSRRLRLGIAPAIRPIWRGRPGHPALVDVDAARTALAGGDRGLAALRFAFVSGHRGSTFDIDTRAAWRAARRMAARFG